MKKIALLFVGQGAQAVGMGCALAEQFPVAGDLCAKTDQILGRKLTDIMWKGPEEKLTKTANCQPALFLHGLTAVAVVRPKFREFFILFFSGFVFSVGGGVSAL